MLEDSRYGSGRRIQTIDFRYLNSRDFGFREAEEAKCVCLIQSIVFERDPADSRLVRRPLGGAIHLTLDQVEGRRWPISAGLRARYVITLVAVAAGVAQGFGRFSYAVMLPEMTRTYLHSYALAGSVGLANVGAYLLGTALVSFLATRVKSKSLVVWGLFLSTAGMTMNFMSHNVYLTMLSMAICGLGGSFIWVPTPGIAARSVEVRFSGLAMGLAGAGIGVLISISAELARVLHVFGGQLAWRLQWAIQAGFGLLVLVLVIAFLPKETGKPDLQRGSAKDLMRVPGWKSVTLAYTAYGLSYALFFTFFVAEIEHGSRISSSTASIDFGIIGFVSIFGGIVSGRLSDLFGRTLIMAGGFLFMVLSSLLVLIGGSVEAMVAAILFGVPMSGVANSVASFIGDDVPARSFSAVFGLVTLSFGVAQALATQLGGSLASVMGSFTGDFVISGFAALAGVGLSLSAGYYRKLSRLSISRTSSNNAW